jgi:hypothetical protein
MNAVEWGLPKQIGYALLRIGVILLLWHLLYGVADWGFLTPLFHKDSRSPETKEFERLKQKYFPAGRARM